MSGPAAIAGQWYNDTLRFWDELEFWGGLPIAKDTAPEAVALESHLVDTDRELDRVIAGASGPAGMLDYLIAVPGLLLAYYGMRIERVLSKRAVKEGLASGLLYVNIGVGVVFLRTLLPRLLIGGTAGDLSTVAETFGIPDVATLQSALASLQAMGSLQMVGLYTSLFVLEKLLFVQEFFPLQVILKTLAPALFGGLVTGALTSAACETLAACVAFSLGRAFLTTRLREVSFPGGKPFAEQTWFGALTQSAEDDGLRLTLLLRLAPVIPVPFDAYWYILGALPVGVFEFCVGHYLGCLKTAFLDASMGMLLLTALTPETDASSAQTQTVILGETVGLLLVFLLVSTVATDLVKKMLGLDEEGR